MMMAYAKDGKLPYRHFFKEWFSFINELKKNSLTYQDNKNPAIKPMKQSVPQDISSIQKLLKMGGDCKYCDLFCHMCACRSFGANIQLLFWREGHLNCKENCLSETNSSATCFRWQVDDDKEIEQKKKLVHLTLLFDELPLLRLKPTCSQNSRLIPSIVKDYYTSHNIFSDTHVEEYHLVISGT